MSAECPTRVHHPLTACPICHPDQREAILRADLECLTTAVADCARGEDCPCHEAEWRELRSVQRLLAEEPQAR